MAPSVVDALTPEQLSEKWKSAPGAYVLLDVREAEERETAHIEPSIHIPMSEVPGRLAELPRDATLVVYCHHGGRSAMVAGYLEGEGFEHLVNLTGGIDRWSSRVDPSVPRY
jgi:rhodanese-related sulfurtransferase